MDFKKEIMMLINSKQEGSYWDFKQKWHDNKGDLLHDIICMSNNLVDKDCYIIIGVVDKTYEIVDITNDQNRYDTQKLVDFLKDKKFAGGVRPMVVVKTIEIENKKLDVIVIENNKNTPFYLTENFQNVHANSIYTRVQDTNTPKPNNADIDKIEYLWKKRFGLNSSIMEKLNILLDDWANWGIYKDSFHHIEFKQGGDFGNYDYILHRIHPEFRIEIDKQSHQKWKKETLKCFYINQTAGHYKAKVYYNNTILYEFNIAHVDEYRKYIVVPPTTLFNYRTKGTENNIIFYYLLKDSIIGKVQKILTSGTYETSSRFTGEFWLPIFENEKELSDYINYCESNGQLIKANFKNYENCKGDEEEGAHFPMSNIINAYRCYMEFCIVKGKLTESEVKRYLSYYEKLCV